MKQKRSDQTLRCSFCHKSQEVVGKLISTPGDYPKAYICDECVAVCNSILEDDKPDHAGPNLSSLLKPQELKERLDQYVVGQARCEEKAGCCGLQPLQTSLHDEAARRGGRRRVAKV